MSRLRLWALQMRKLAIFVEGYTEILFVDRLLSEIAGAHNIVIEQKRIRGGKTVQRSMSIINAAKSITNEKYFVLLFDCGGDSQVKTRIQEEHANLTQNGYTKIIGLRDVRSDFTHADIPKLLTGLRKYVKTSLIPVEFVLSILEIEAWFLAEFHHFPKIDPAITVEAIKANLSFDPELDEISLRLTPTDDLRAAYSLGGKDYEKSNAKITVASLNYGYIYMELQHKIPELQRLVTSIDQFLV